MQTARLINDNKPNWVLNRVIEKAKRFKEPVIGCLGLTYKPDIDDLRESPALLIARKLSDSGIGKVIVCEPNVAKIQGLDLRNLDDLLKKADILVALVAHRQFKRVSGTKLEEKIIIDTCGVWR